MFREMRRKKQILSEKKCIEVLEKGTAGVLALLGDNDYPYAVPISYVYYNSKLFFHGAKSGHKKGVSQNNRFVGCGVRLPGFLQNLMLKIFCVN